jgi:hypothetical membrane protein
MTNNSTVAGTLLFVGGVQFVIALFIAEAIYPSYSISANLISDLGVWGRSSAPIFDISTMLFGFTVLASSRFIYKAFHTRVIAVLFAVAGAGALGVGVFPENTFVIHGVPVIHTVSALLGFVIGAISVVAASKITRGPFRYLSLVVGAVGLLSVALFVTTRYSGGLGIGAGGMERMMVYPTVLWLVGFGGYLLGATSK